MLLSLQAGGVGLTLTSANHVFITDLHWWVWSAYYYILLLLIKGTLSWRNRHQTVVIE